VNAGTHKCAGQCQWMYLPARNYFFRLALATSAVQQQILKGMAVLPSDLVTWTLRGANRVAVKVADLILLRAGATISPTSLLEWLTLCVAERTVGIFEHLNRHANTARTAPPANHDRCRSAHGERGGGMTSSANADWPIQLRSHQPETTVALLRMLGIEHAPIEQQKPLVRMWLTANRPSTELRISLRRNGYGSVLDDVFGRPTACNYCAPAV
jgi:hypothetical protein